MEFAALIVAFGVLVVSGVAAVATVVQARAATASSVEAREAVADAKGARDEAQRLASVATAAFVRQAEAQERANELKEAEMAPPTWSGPEWKGGHRYSVTNSSGETLVVERFEVQPDGSEGRISVQDKKDGVYTYGDSFSYVTSAALQVRAEKLTVFWRRQATPDAELNEFIIPL
jgi:hypothetical protein